jgi:Na+-translocating ferredoxin:NAD+ oxidoreductase subunit D
MLNEKLYAGAHAPFWHNGDTIRARSYNIMVAALPAVFMGIYLYGVPALRVMALAVAGAMFWEWLLNQAMRRPSTIGDGNAAVIGLLLGMLLPATMPWYAVIVTSFVAVVIGKLIYGGVGCNPLNPTLVGLAILMLSWQSLVDFDAALGHYDMDFYMLYPLGAVKAFGAGVVDRYSMSDLLWGRQAGGIGSTFGLGLLVGGCYLMARGFIRWEISLSFLAGLFLTALLFHLADPGKYAGPVFHVLTGYSLIGAFFPGHRGFVIAGQLYTHDPLRPGRGCPHGLDPQYRGLSGRGGVCHPHDECGQSAPR